MSIVHIFVYRSLYYGLYDIGIDSIGKNASFFKKFILA